MATQTEAEKIASAGVSALDAKATKQLEDAESYIKQAGKKMDEIRPAINKINNGEPLSFAEKQILLTEAGFDRAALDERMGASPDPEWVKRFNNENPRAYFYVDLSDGSRLLVEAFYKGKAKLTPDTDESFR